MDLYRYLPRNSKNFVTATKHSLFDARRYAHGILKNSPVDGGCVISNLPTDASGNQVFKFKGGTYGIRSYLLWASGDSPRKGRIVSSCGRHNCISKSHLGFASVVGAGMTPVDPLDRRLSEQERIEISRTKLRNVSVDRESK